jgi:hypothetical protein
VRVHGLATPGALRGSGGRGLGPRSALVHARDAAEPAGPPAHRGPRRDARTLCPQPRRLRRRHPRGSRHRCPRGHDGPALRVDRPPGERCLPHAIDRPPTRRNGGVLVPPEPHPSSAPASRSPTGSTRSTPTRSSAGSSASSSHRSPPTASRAWQCSTRSTA